MSSDSTRMEVVQCERDIQSIKAALRQISDESKPNSLEVVWTKLEGVEADDSVEVSLQLSSPVEEATLKKVREGDDAAEGSSISFSGVESSMATLTVTLKKDGQVLGTSEAFDMAPVCSLGDAMNPKEEYIIELPVAIMAPAGEGAAASEEKPSEDAAATETAEKEEDKETSEENKEEEDKPATTEPAKEDPDIIVKPQYTLSLKMIFKPSAKDQKEELYELLNKASLRRSQALDRHRGEQSAVAAKKTSPTKKPAVKAGFLNKKPKEEEQSKLMQFYNKYLGPKSLGRGVLFPVAKNYLIFFGAVALFHFKGQELALPAPV